jgi:hypothetical protein
MDNQEFADVLNNMKDLTIGQILKLVLKVKYKTVIMLLGIIAIGLGGAFTAGKYSQQKETAVMLESPFAMRIVIDDVNYDFENLTLIKDPTKISITEDKIVLSLREIKSPFDIQQVGNIVARVEIEKISKFWDIFVNNSIDIVSESHAKDNEFDWNGHENDLNFTERFVEKDTVNRYYSDGCILEYRVDENRRSIPDSFFWIRINH